jgi:hypothetical protein
MDILTEKHKSGLDQLRLFPVVFHSALQIVSLIAGFQVLTKEELANAGINLGSDQNEE